MLQIASLIPLIIFSENIADGIDRDRFKSIYELSHPLQEYIKGMNDYLGLYRSRRTYEFWLWYLEDLLERFAIDKDVFLLHTERKAEVRGAFCRPNLSSISIANVLDKLFFSTQPNPWDLDPESEILVFSHLPPANAVTGARGRDKGDSDVEATEKKV